MINVQFLCDLWVCRLLVVSSRESKQFRQFHIPVLFSQKSLKIGNENVDLHTGFNSLFYESVKAMFLLQIVMRQQLRIYKMIAIEKG